MNLTVAALAAGVRSFRRSRAALLMGFVGALYGFFFFCYPWLRTGFFGPNASPWLVCTTITVVNAAAPVLVILIAYVVREVLGTKKADSKSA